MAVQGFGRHKDLVFVQGPDERTCGLVSHVLRCALVCEIQRRKAFSPLRLHQQGFVTGEGV